MANEERVWSTFAATPIFHNHFKKVGSYQYKFLRFMEARLKRKCYDDVEAALRTWNDQERGWGRLLNVIYWKREEQRNFDWDPKYPISFVFESSEFQDSTGFVTLPMTVPVPNSDRDETINLTFGEILLQTAWARCLTPRVSIITEARTNATDPQKAIVMRFKRISNTIPYNLTRPPLPEILDATLVSNAFEIDTTIENNRGVMLEEFLTTKKGWPQLNEDLRKLYNIEFVIHPLLKHEYIALKLEGIESLQHVLEVLGLCIDYEWEWIGDNKIALFPGPSYTGTKRFDWIKRKQE